MALQPLEGVIASFMDAELWLKVKQIFDETCDLDAAERARRLDEVCNGSEELRIEVEKLLSANDELEDFIEEPAFSVSDVVHSLDEPAVDKTIGHYKVVREIGRGGMGTVFLVTRDDGEFQQQAAIKVVSSAFLGNESVRRFRQERQILAGLNHPNIARLLDGGVTDDGLPFLVMEYVDGVPLVDYANTKDLSVRDRLQLFLKVCRAVSYAHASLIVHRDIKPSNILVTADGEPKLLDFGLAKITDVASDELSTATNFRALTPAYASPEQLRGEPITTASDVYSLGVVLYELLTGQRPFDDRSVPFERMVRLVSDSAPERPSSKIGRTGPEHDPSVRDPRTGKLLTGDIDNIVLMAMRSRPERRYRSVEQFAADIGRHLDGRTIIAADDTFAYRASKFLSRHRIGVAAAITIVLVLVSGILATAWQARAARHERDAAEAERERAERINKFLQEMLSYSNQSWSSAATSGRARDVTINEMLDEIAPRVETELADQPDMQANILLTIGNAYNSQGRYEAAEKYLRDALTVARAHAGETSPETLDILGALGETLFQTGKYDEGEQIYAGLITTIREHEAAFENGKYRLAGALHGLGSVKLIHGDATSAVPLLREAAATATAAAPTGKERGLLAEIELNLAGALITLGDLDESEGLLRESFAIFRELPGEPRWEMGVTLTRLGDCLVRKRQYVEGEGFLLQGAELYRKAFGESNHYLARNFNIRARAALSQGNEQEAETLSREALDILDHISPSPELVRANALFTLGTSLCSTKRSREGKTVLRQSIEIYQRNSASETADAERSLNGC